MPYPYTSEGCLQLGLNFVIDGKLSFLFTTDRDLGVGKMGLLPVQRCSYILVCILINSYFSVVYTFARQSGLGFIQAVKD